MRIAIAGAGNVGRSIAQELIGNGHQVMLIERQPRQLRPERVPQAEWVLADACELTSLEEADVAGCDVVVAATGDDKANLVVSLLAKTEFAVGRVVARIYDARRALVYERLGIPTVATIRWAADRMMRQLVPEGTVEVFRDPTSVISIGEVPLHSDWVGKTLKSLEERTGARVAYLMRFGMGMLGTPSTTIQDGDQVYMLVTDDTVADVLDVAAGAEKEGH